jgi:hypothetical protein
MTLGNSTGSFTKYYPVAGDTDMAGTFYNNTKVDGEFWTETDVELVEDGFDRLEAMMPTNIVNETAGAVFISTTDTQTLTNKTLTSPTITGTVGGSVEFANPVTADGIPIGTGGASGIAIGTDALSSAGALAYSNIAIGTNSLDSLTTGDENVVIGVNAAAAMTYTGSCVAVGHNAMQNATVPDGDVAIGYRCLRSSDGVRNTAVGYISLLANTTGTYNTAIGAYAGSDITAGSKNTILGCFTGNVVGVLDIRTSDNYIVLSDGDGNPEMYWDGSAWTAKGALTVEGNLTSTGIDDNATSTKLTIADSAVTVGADGSAPILVLSATGTIDEGAELTLNGAGSYKKWIVDSYQNFFRVFTNAATDYNFTIDNIGAGVVNGSIDGSWSATNYTSSAAVFSIYANGGVASGGAIQVFDATSSSKVSILHNNSEKAYVDASGLSVTGTVTPSGGIQLGGATAANNLDDYEEGTWTPVINGSSSNPTFSTANGRYTKVGRQVTCDIQMIFSTAGSGTYLLLNSSLPFTPSFLLGGVIGTAGVLDNGTSWYAASTFNDGTQQLIVIGSAGTTFSSTSPFTVVSGDALHMSFTYFV